MIVRVVFQPPPDAIWLAELETTAGVALSEILSKDALPLPAANSPEVGASEDSAVSTVEPASSSTL